ncbi:MAG: heparinase [Candidatus Aminicenantes bacterium]|nr:heparinase [Candidatus Aminicenantes bacterium]
MKIFLCACLFTANLSAAQEPSRAGLLAPGWTPDKLKEALLTVADWHPFPRTAEREGWEAVSPEVRAALLKTAEKHLGTGWPTPRASVFLDYVRNGNRSRYEAISFGRRTKLAELVLGECVEGKGRFLDEIVDGIWTIAEETYWGVPAHVGAQKRGSGLPDVTEPTVDLFAAETGMLMAWTDYLLGDKLDAVSPLVRERIRYEVGRRILTPNLARDDFWWMGVSGRALNNWTPWICSNWIAAALLVEPNPDRRARSVLKAMECIDRFLSFYHPDGGCDEGPGYWDRAGGSLYDCLELLAGASRGKIDVYSAPLVREIGRYIARAYIRNGWYINFADAAAKLSPSAALIYRYGRAVGDPDLAGFGALLARRQGLGREAVRGSFGALGRALPTIFALPEITAAEPREPLYRDVWMPGLQVMAARTKEGSAAGLYLAAKGGHNAESHNHNDVGNFIVYADGEPALIDVGVETYTAKTFSGRRYEIWTMQSAYHNLPTVNGFMEKEGREYEARKVVYKAEPVKVVFGLDLAGAYPKEAGISSWARTLTFTRGKEIALSERYALSAVKAPLKLSLMSARRPVKKEEGRIVLENPAAAGGAGAAGSAAASPQPAPVVILYDKGFFKAEVETIALEDERLKASWGASIYRIVLTAARPPAKGEYTVRIKN